METKIDYAELAEKAAKELNGIQSEGWSGPRIVVYAEWKNGELKTWVRGDEATMRIADDDEVYSVQAGSSETGMDRDMVNTCREEWDAEDTAGKSDEEIWKEWCKLELEHDPDEDVVTRIAEALEEWAGRNQPEEGEEEVVNLKKLGRLLAKADWEVRWLNGTSGDFRIKVSMIGYQNDGPPGVLPTINLGDEDSTKTMFEDDSWTDFWRSLDAVREKDEDPNRHSALSNAVEKEVVRLSESTRPTAPAFTSTDPARNT